MRTLLLLVFIATASLLTTQCQHDPFPLQVEEIVTTDSNLVFGTPDGECSLDSVYFERDVLPLITSFCVSCHGPTNANDGVRLSTYDEIMRFGKVVPGDPTESELYEVLIDGKAEERMPPPPSSALPPTDIAMIKTWIEQGAKNNTCDFETNIDSICDPSNVSFADEVNPILSSYGCISCHSGGSVILNTYEGVKALAENGRLLGSIKHESGYRAMPDGGGKMDSCDIATIEVWINEGINDN